MRGLMGPDAMGAKERLGGSQGRRKRKSCSKDEVCRFTATHFVSHTVIEIRDTHTITHTHTVGKADMSNSQTVHTHTHTLIDTQYITKKDPNYKRTYTKQSD